MAAIPLIGGAYQARSLIANAQRCVNLYPEENQKDALVPTTHYQRPGLTLLATPPLAGAGRGIWRASNGAGYCVIGQNAYFIDSDFDLHSLGPLVENSGNMCSFCDNGIQGVLVDGSKYGYTVNLASNVATLLVDPTELFQGATKVDYMDSYLLFNVPGQNMFISSLSNETLFDPTYFAGKSAWPDPIVTLACVRRELLLLGQIKSEIWFDAGNVGFPFAELPGVNIEHGCAAPYSVANSDVSLFWLGQDLQGQGVVWRCRGHMTTRLSTHAIEYALQQYTTISDATGYCYQQGGHYFYVLTFPSANVTWVWDDTTSLWHQRAWTDPNGGLNRERLSCCANLYGKNVGLDWQNGNLLQLDPTNYTDQGQPISFIRGFPHIGMAMAPGRSQMAPIEWKRAQYHAFIADVECGTTPLDANGNPAQIWLRWSDDRGRTFGNSVVQSLGAQGATLTQPVWRSLGLGRDRVFELGYSAAGPAALNGAWIEATAENT